MFIESSREIIALDAYIAGGNDGDVAPCGDARLRNLCDLRVHQIGVLAERDLRVAVWQFANGTLYAL